jgi:hypothetical protein
LVAVTRWQHTAAARAGQCSKQLLLLLLPQVHSSSTSARHSLAAPQQQQQQQQCLTQQQQQQHLSSRQGPDRPFRMLLLRWSRSCSTMQLTFGMSSAALLFRG